MRRIPGVWYHYGYECMTYCMIILHTSKDQTRINSSSILLAFQISISLDACGVPKYQLNLFLKPEAGMQQLRCLTSSSFRKCSTTEIPKSQVRIFHWKRIHMTQRSTVHGGAWWTWGELREKPSCERSSNDWRSSCMAFERRVGLAFSHGFLMFFDFDWYAPQT